MVQFKDFYHISMLLLFLFVIVSRVRGLDFVAFVSHPMNTCFMDAVFQTCFKKLLLKTASATTDNHNIAQRHHHLAFLSKNALPLIGDSILYFQIKSKIIFLLVSTCYHYAFYSSYCIDGVMDWFPLLPSPSSCASPDRDIVWAVLSVLPRNMRTAIASRDKVYRTLFPVFGSSWELMIEEWF